MPVMLYENKAKKRKVTRAVIVLKFLGPWCSGSATGTHTVLRSEHRPLSKLRRFTSALGTVGRFSSPAPESKTISHHISATTMPISLIGHCTMVKQGQSILRDPYVLATKYSRLDNGRTRTESSIRVRNDRVPLREHALGIVLCLQSLQTTIVASEQHS